MKHLPIIYIDAQHISLGKACLSEISYCRFVHSKNFSGLQRPVAVALKLTLVFKCFCSLSKQGPQGDHMEVLALKNYLYDASRKVVSVTFCDARSE